MARSCIRPIDVVADQPHAVDAVVSTMACGDACPIFPGKRHEDWKLDDPAGQGIDSVRPIRDDICGRVETLIGELLPAGSQS